MHWHGLHVSPENDGGPHQMINVNGNWNPSFEIKNNAGTFWYHPHGAGQTDPQVSKGIAGMFIVHDANELALNIPHTYGVDDIPIIVQSKAFDMVHQIAIATEDDTAIFVNGTLKALYSAPAQVLRFRLLNGSSLRTYNFGFSNQQSFKLIATDGGLLDTATSLTRLQLSPGERAEILVDFSAMQGQTIYLKSYASQLQNGIYGAAQVGQVPDTIHGYQHNFLNGADFDIFQINVVTPTVGAIHGVPTNLVSLNNSHLNLVRKNRVFVFDTFKIATSIFPNLAEGPFGINHHTYNMDTINEIVYLNTVEQWTLINKTHVAHPFHIHDVQFNVIQKGGMPPTASDRGWKDVVLVMPHDSVKFVTKFEDFADHEMPYMYHCHLLHHEDDGMMGQFLVIDSASIGLADTEKINSIKLFPNPTEKLMMLSGTKNINSVEVIDMMGKTHLFMANISSLMINVESLPTGVYFIKIVSPQNSITKKFIKQ
jgi:bilirubin oxidase